MLSHVPNRLNSVCIYSVLNKHYCAKHTDTLNNRVTFIVNIEFKCTDYLFE